MRYLSWFSLTLVLASIQAQAQPVPPPDSGDAVCEEFPREIVEPDLSHPDAEGFHSLFNGLDLDGWWLNCRSSHSAPSIAGPIFRVDTVRKALYSTQRGNAGGVLMTKAKFMDYEIVFDYWPDWGNEAHLQHRTDTLGRAYNTTLGYMGGTSFGGVWGEAVLIARDLRPFSFGMGDTNISIPGLIGGPSWTQITQKLKAAGENVPCPETGCTQEDWRRLWDFDNWNQMRVTFHGGRNKEDSIHARSWFRKLGALDWVPLGADTTLLMEMKPGYIGLMVHGNGRYGGPKGTWYRNIRWKPWTATMPVAVPGVPFPTAHRPTHRVDRDRHMIRIVFENPVPTRNLQVLSLEGKTMVELKGMRGEAMLNTTGWKQGVYLLGMGAGGHRDWTRLILP